MHFQSNKAIQCKTLEAFIYHFHLRSPKNGWQIWNQEPKMQGRRVTAAAKSKNFPFSTNSNVNVFCFPDAIVTSAVSMSSLRDM